MRNYWAAIAKGGKVKTLMDRVANSYVILATSDIRQCSDLAGKRMGLGSLTGITKSLLDAYIEAKCPGTKFQEVVLTSGENIGAALLTDTVDAGVVQVAEAIRLQQQAPQKLHSLVNFAQEFPQLKVTGYHVRDEFAAAQPNAVKDFIRAILTAHRRFQNNSELVQAQAAKRLKLDAAVVAPITQTYFDLNAWDVNGGLTSADVQATLDFYTDAGDLKEGLTVEQVADLSYLAAVLDEIGRK